MISAVGQDSKLEETHCPAGKKKISLSPTPKKTLRFQKWKGQKAFPLTQLKLFERLQVSPAVTNADHSSYPCPLLPSREPVRLGDSVPPRAPAPPRDPTRDRDRPCPLPWGRRVPYASACPLFFFFFLARLGRPKSAYPFPPAWGFPALSWPRGLAGKDAGMRLRSAPRFGGEHPVLPVAVPAACGQGGGAGGDDNWALSQPRNDAAHAPSIVSRSDWLHFRSSVSPHPLLPSLPPPPRLTVTLKHPPRIAPLPPSPPPPAAPNSFLRTVGCWWALVRVVGLHFQAGSRRDRWGSRGGVCADRGKQRGGEGENRGMKEWERGRPCTRAPPPAVGAPPAPEKEQPPRSPHPPIGAPPQLPVRPCQPPTRRRGGSAPLRVPPRPTAAASRPPTGLPPHPARLPSPSPARMRSVRAGTHSPRHWRCLFSSIPLSFPKKPQPPPPQTTPLICIPVGTLARRFPPLRPTLLPPHIPGATGWQKSKLVPIYPGCLPLNTHKVGMARGGIPRSHSPVFSKVPSPPPPLPSPPRFLSLNWLYLDVHLFCLALFNIADEIGRKRSVWLGMCLWYIYIYFLSPLPRLICIWGLIHISKSWHLRTV